MKKNSLQKTIGIIGGMGPAATALLFSKIVDMTDAECDADHIHIYIDNYTAIPDRTASIKSGSDLPVEYICESGEKLISIGADILVIPCNTSHYYYDKIQHRLKVPVINMLGETAFLCKTRGYKKVGVLATDGTRNTGIFDTELSKCGIEAVYPSAKGQKEVMSVIYDQIKAGKSFDTRELSKYISEMVNFGAEAFILGCTELPMALRDGDYGYRFIDTLDVLAQSAIHKAGYRSKKRDLFLQKR